MTGRAALYLSLALIVGIFGYVLYPETATERAVASAETSAGASAEASADASAQALPVGFSESKVADVPLPTAIAFTPDDRMLVTSKPGYVYAVQDGQRRQVLNRDAQTCENSERGMLGIAVDPRFEEGQEFVYIYYTYKKYAKCLAAAPESPKNPVNRVSRFQVRPDGTIAEGSEKVLINNIMSTKGNHNGGDLHFGPDGNLYVSVGDGGCDYAEPTKCQYENDSSRDKHILNGKILRITPGGAIPAGNPFTGPDSARCNVAGKTQQGKNCQETYLKGFRNPFRFAVDPDAAGTKLRINDVGGNSWEEIDQATAADAGSDYGWNICEGRHDNEDRRGSVNCDGAALTGPIHEYSHDTGCSSITGGAFVPNEAGWPAEYDDAYLFGDYVCGRIFALTPEGNGFNRTTIVDGLSERAGPIGMTFGPHGADDTSLYFATFENGGAIRRLAYGTPSARIEMAPGTNPYGPLTMSFDASGSRDPRNGTLNYTWNFGDGETQTTNTPTVEHTYAGRGRYTARLTVTVQGSGASDTATIDVFPGDQPPEPTIQSPADESSFVVDEQLQAAGSATDPDPDDGTSLTWQVLRHHRSSQTPNGSHTHPWASGTGESVGFPAPAPEDLDSTDPTGNFLEVRLTATDELGLSKTTSIELRPDTVDLTFDTRPEPLRLKVNGQAFRAPRTIPSWVGYDLNVTAPRQRDAQGRTYVFGSWSDGRAASHTIDSPQDPTTYTATFRRPSN